MSGHQAVKAETAEEMFMPRCLRRVEAQRLVSLDGVWYTHPDLQAGEVVTVAMPASGRSGGPTWWLPDGRRHPLQIVRLGAPVQA